MADAYERTALTELTPTPEKPAERFEITAALGLSGYNFNVAVLDAGERLPQSGLHYHDAQEEFFYVVDGRCRVELADESVDLDRDEMIVIRPGTAQMIHNPFGEQCKLIAIGYPPEGHATAEIVKPAEEVLAERNTEVS
jgi:mannose-6-phosphate isomerase-like protein (cupin superfamily)